MPSPKFVVKNPKGAAYEVTMEDIHQYLKKGDITREWMARRDGETAWQKVGALLEQEPAPARRAPAATYQGPGAITAEPEPASDEATRAMFEAESVATPSSVMHRLETMKVPVKVSGALAGIALGCLLGNIPGGGGRGWFLITGAVLGGGLGLFFGYLAALALDWAIQMLTLQENIAGKNRHD
jgi:hypothetical protein